MKKSTIAVTGISGKLGRHIIELLLEQNIAPLIGLTRTPDKHADLVGRGVDVRYADFDDKDSVVAASVGVDRIVLISTDTMDGTDRRIVQHRHAIEAMREVGVSHIVYTSFLQSRSRTTSLLSTDHAATEAILECSGMGYTVLRNAFYQDLLFASLGNAAVSGKFFSAAGAGGISYVARQDCAWAAASAVANACVGNHVLEITGPTAVNSAELARMASDVFGKAIEYIPVDIEVRKQKSIEQGMPAPAAGVLAGVERWVSTGAMDIVSDDFKKLTGKSAGSVAEFLYRHREIFLIPPGAVQSCRQG